MRTIRPRSVQESPMRGDQQPLSARVKRQMNRLIMGVGKSEAEGERHWLNFAAPCRLRIGRCFHQRRSGALQLDMEAIQTNRRAVADSVESHVAMLVDSDSEQSS